MYGDAFFKSYRHVLGHVGTRTFNRPLQTTGFLQWVEWMRKITIAYCWTEAYRALPPIHLASILVQQCDMEFVSRVPFVPALDSWKQTRH